MATMNVSLPEPLRDFIDAKVATGNYATTSDYVRSLVRRDRISDLYEKMLRAAIEKGLKSGIDPRSPEQIFADILSGRSKMRGPADPMVTGELVWPEDDEHWDMDKFGRELGTVELATAAAPAFLSPPPLGEGWVGVFDQSRSRHSASRTPPSPPLPSRRGFKNYASSGNNARNRRCTACISPYPCHPGPAPGPSPTNDVRAVLAHFASLGPGSSPG